MSYEIKLPIFQGPFDLLLFFIERDELDIRDIPIAKVANDFLDYLHHLELMNLEVASEFILVAATLMQIKAKMLLPRPVIDELGNELDPRDELIKHLLEYKKYKSVVATFSELEENRSLLQKRGNIMDEIRLIGDRNNVEAELQDLDLYKLLKVYMKVMGRYEAEKSKPIHTVTPYAYTIEQQKEYILESIRKMKKIAFSDIITEMPDKIAIIFNFLSILELLQTQHITIIVGEGFNNFWIEEKVMSNA